MRRLVVFLVLWFLLVLVAARRGPRTFYYLQGCPGIIYTGHPKNQKTSPFHPHPIPSPCIPTFGPPLRSIQLSPPSPPQSPSRCPRRTRCRAPRAPVYWSCRARAGSVSWRPRGRPRWCRGGCPRRWCRLRNYTGGVLCAWLV